MEALSSIPSINVPRGHPADTESPQSSQGVAQKQHPGLFQTVFQSYFYRLFLLLSLSCPAVKEHLSLERTRVDKSGQRCSGHYPGFPTSKISFPVYTRHERAVSRFNCHGGGGKNPRSMPKSNCHTSAEACLRVLSSCRVSKGKTLHNQVPGHIGSVHLLFSPACIATSFNCVILFFDSAL